MSDCPHPYDLQSYADKAVSAAEREAIRDHLQDCPVCTARVRELQRLHAILQTRAVSVPDGLLQRLIEALRHVTPVRKLSCGQALEMASAYLDGELDGRESETLETHLFACEECYVEYVAMRAAAQAMRQAPRVQAGADLKARILAAVEQQSPEKAVSRPAPARTWTGWRRALAPMMAVAAVALLAFGAFQVLQQSAPTPAATVTVADRPSEAPVSPADTVRHEAPAAHTEPVPAAEPAAAPAEPAPGGEEMVAGAPPATPESDEFDAASRYYRDDTPRPMPVGARPGRSRDTVVRPPAPSTATVSRREAPGRAPAGSRPVEVIEPPMVALAPSHPTRSGPGAGLRTGARTERASAPRSLLAARGGTLSQPPLPPSTRGVSGVGVTAERAIARAEGGTSAPVRPAAESMVASAPPLTRPEVRTVHEVGRDEEFDAPSEGGLARRGLVASAGSSSRVVYSGRNNVSERLRESADRINREIKSEARLGEGDRLTVTP